MRRIVPPAALLLVAVACSGGPSPAASTTSALPAAPSATGVVVPPSTSVPTPSLPPGVPISYEKDVASGDVPLEALVPSGATVDGSWYATLPAGDAIVVAYEEASGDPFRAPRGLVVWRHFDTPPPWRATFGLAHPADEGVLSIDAIVADVTGDGSPDALVMESTGGSGTCGTWRVLDLAEGMQAWEKGDLCDAQVTPSTTPVGLTVTQSVFKPNDSHCCPSAIRTTTLSYAGNGEWIVAARKTRPIG